MMNGNDTADTCSTRTGTLTTTSYVSTNMMHTIDTADTCSTRTGNLDDDRPTHMSVFYRFARGGGDCVEQ
jgi:hypothetical protein